MNNGIHDYESYHSIWLCVGHNIIYTISNVVIIRVSIALTFPVYIAGRYPICISIIQLSTATILKNNLKL